MGAGLTTTTSTTKNLYGKQLTGALPSMSFFFFNFSMCVLVGGGGHYRFIKSFTLANECLMMITKNTLLILILVKT